MIGVKKGERIEPIPTEQSESPILIVQFIEIQPEVEDPVAEPVHLRHQPMVHHSALVQSGVAGRALGFWRRAAHFRWNIRLPTPFGFTDVKRSRFRSLINL